MGDPTPVIGQRLAVVPLRQENRPLHLGLVNLPPGLLRPQKFPVGLFEILSSHRHHHIGHIARRQAFDLVVDHLLPHEGPPGGGVKEVPDGRGVVPVAAGSRLAVAIADPLPEDAVHDLKKGMAARHGNGPRLLGPLPEAHGHNLAGGSLGAGHPGGERRGGTGGESQQQ